MTVDEVIVDTSVLIDYLRGHTEASRFLEARRQLGVLSTHVVVVAEVLAGARNRQEQNSIDEFMREFRVYPVDGTDSEVALELFRTHRLAHGVGWLDCLIGATARRVGLPIATLNEKHFATIGDLVVERPY